MITDTSVRCFERLTNLKYLQMDATKISDELFSVFSKCKKLKSISLGSFNNLIVDDSISKLANNFLLLENIFIGALNLTDKSLIEISTNCKNVKVISFVNASKFTDVGIKSLLRCRELTSLVLGKSSEISQESLMNFFKNSKNLNQCFICDFGDSDFANKKKILSRDSQKCHFFQKSS
eukprot:TRINITY_DN16941_c0_g1_i1.p1 TRINITY_DN16941_c0_g1~~TRINITY_DN16941_c0_g1_i1.p1  ORF type:complete len:178 (-),score=23.10 TRINITY_DN16941_c0_g1_i1:51-584(-)